MFKCIENSRNFFCSYQQGNPFFEKASFNYSNVWVRKLEKAKETSRAD